MSDLAIFHRFFHIVEIDLIHKGIKTLSSIFLKIFFSLSVEIDLIHKGIKTQCQKVQIHRQRMPQVEIDLIHKGIKTG